MPHDHGKGEKGALEKSYFLFPLDVVCDEIQCQTMQAKKTLKQLDDMGHQSLPSINQFTILFAKVAYLRAFSCNFFASRF